MRGEQKKPTLLAPDPYPSPLFCVGEVMSETHRQEQFLTVLDRDEAERRFHQHLDLSPLVSEMVPLFDAHQRVLAEDIHAPIDVPGFDRSNVDGFAVRAEDTFGAAEDAPVVFTLNVEVLRPGSRPTQTILPHTATSIATGGMTPRGASAVVMIEHTEVRDGHLVLNRAAAPGLNITWAGTDIGCGETVLSRGTYSRRGKPASLRHWACTKSPLFASHVWRSFQPATRFNNRGNPSAWAVCSIVTRRY